jgi:hypothetical protein
MIELQARIEQWNREAAALRQSIPVHLRCVPAIGGALKMQEEAAAIMEAMTDAAQSAAMVEREACARVADGFNFNQRPDIDQPRTMARYIAAAIRKGNSDHA